jgi:hypothetical protein
MGRSSQKTLPHHHFLNDALCKVTRIQTLKYFFTKTYAC